MTKPLALLAALAVLPTAALADGPGGVVDETPGGGMEEAAALYAVAPPTEEAGAVVDEASVAEAGTVQLAALLGQVEAGLEACRTLRREMQALIGDEHGSYSVNPGWLRRYQSCVLRRAGETRALGDAIGARQRELIGRIGQEEEGGDAMRAADMMARIAARQSEVQRGVAREGRMQRHFVRYYNTGDMPDALVEARAPAPEAPAKAGMDEANPAGQPPLDTAAPAPVASPSAAPATGAPVTLRR